MGLFSSKKKTTVGTSISRVIPDDGIPNATRTGLIKAIFRNGDIGQYVMEEIVNGVAVKAERMFEYARSSYTWGLPSGYAKDSVQGRAEVEAHLSAMEGDEITAQYLHYGPPNTSHIGWIKLIAEHGYNQATNTLAGLTAQKGAPVYLESMQLYVPMSMVEQVNSGSIDQWGISPTTGVTLERLPMTPEFAGLVQWPWPWVDEQATDDYLRIHYQWRDPNYFGGNDGDPIGPILRAYFDIPVTEYDEDADYFQACYTVGDSPLRKYWIYKVGSGVYPVLDALYDDPIEQGTFFPFAYFRYDKKSTVEDKTTEDYRTSKKLLKYLGMDYDTVADAVNANPDIDDVEQAMLMMAVPVNTTNELERRYLYSFFEAIYNSAGDRFTTRMDAQSAAALLANGQLIKTTMVVQDRRFKLSLSNGGIYKKRVVGSIGPVGSHDSGRDELVIPVDTQNENGLGGGALIPVKVSVHYFRRQRSKMIYDEIRVVDMTTMFHIFGKYMAVGDDAEDILLVPLDRSITTAYSTKDREVLYSRSLHMVFNSRVITKVKWYQSEWFQLVLIVVAVVITVLSLGADGGQSLTLALAAGQITLAAALNIILTGILEYLVQMYVVKLFIQAVGIEAAFVIAILAAMSGMAMKYDLISVPGAPWAKDLLTIGNALMSGVTNTIKDMSMDLLDEASDFSKYVEEQTKLLDTASDLLDNQTLLSPLTVFGEKPEDFFNRTIHSGNIGALGIDAISSYVDIALTLPKLDETVGDTFYVAV